MEISEIMSPATISYAPKDSLHHVVRSMATKHHSCGVICEQDAPVGIITERDVLRMLAAAGNVINLYDTQVSDIMTHDPICVGDDIKVDAALDLARSRNLRHLPVVDGRDRLIGIVTMTDLVKAFTSLTEMNSSLVKENSKLHVMAIEDPLTGLPNRRAMDIDLRHTEAVSVRREECYSIALMDIDYFKGYNDHYGHQGGDRALQQVAKILNHGMREADRLYRYGGEEFLLLMPFTATSGAMMAAQRLSKAIQDAEIEHCKSHLGVLTLCIGIATQMTGESAKEVIVRADAALYDAKQQGRNCVRLNQVTGDQEFPELNRRPVLDEQRPAPS